MQLLDLVLVVKQRLPGLVSLVIVKRINWVELGQQIIRKWSSSSSHKFEVSFLNPHLDDSPWSMGFSGYMRLRKHSMLQYRNSRKRYQGHLLWAELYLNNLGHIFYLNI